MGLAVNFIVPTLVTPVDAELSPSSDTGWLSHDLIEMLGSLAMSQSSV